MFRVTSNCHLTLKKLLIQSFIICNRYVYIFVNDLRSIGGNLHMGYEHLFEKGKIGDLTLKNRVVMPGMSTNLAGPNGEITDHQIRYYEERAKGGTGLIITEFTTIDSELGRAGANQLRIDGDHF